MYIGMLRYYCSSPGGLPKWIFDEIQSVTNVSYKFDDEQSPEDLVVSIAETLVPVPYSLPPERLLDGQNLYFEYDQSAIKDILDNYLKPENARIDIVSSLFEKHPEFSESKEEIPLSPSLSDTSDHHYDNDGYASEFNLDEIGPPQIEPMFGTKFWCNKIHASIIDEWRSYATETLPPDSSSLALPQKNPYVPKRFSTKPLPKDDAHHPMLQCSVKICTTIGKSKVRTMNYVFVSYVRKSFLFLCLTFILSRFGFLRQRQNTTVSQKHYFLYTKMKKKFGI